MEEQINYLVKIFQRKLSATPMSFFRYLYPMIDWNDTLIGIKGPKGCGKSTLLLQHIKEAFKGKDIEKHYTFHSIICGLVRMMSLKWWIITILMVVLTFSSMRFIIISIGKRF